MSAASYLVLQWRGAAGRQQARSLERAAAASGLRSAATGDGWQVLLDEAVPRSGSDGLIIVGSYHRERPKGGSGDAATVVERARRIVGDGWGAYVALLIDGGVHVLRDPSGAMPAWFLDTAEITVVSDRLTPAMVRSVGVDPGVRPEGLAACLVDPACAVHLQLLDAIREITPGDLLERGGAEPVPVWRPTTVDHTDGAHGEARLREAVERTVLTMAPTRTLLQLSGGLDSAIVLGVLAGAGREVHAFNFSTGDAAGDESAYARMVAEALGTPLQQRCGLGLFDLSALARQYQGAAPATFGLDVAFERATDEVARSLGFAEVMTGQGGDAVFFQPATALTAVDHGRSGPGAKAFLRALPSTARRTGGSFWPLLLSVLADRLVGARVPTQLFCPGLLTTEALSHARKAERRHPWLRDAAGLPPGKRMQIVMISNGQMVHHPRPGGAVTLLHPLLSQPVIEAALSIPTFVLSGGATDRALARSAFRDLLPACLLSRRTKGDASEYFSRAMQANLPFLREYLLDGELGRLGLLHRDAMDRLLSHESLVASSDYLALPMYVSCEAWARSWRA